MYKNRFIRGNDMCPINGTYVMLPDEAVFFVSGIIGSLCIRSQSIRSQSIRSQIDDPGIIELYLDD